MDAAGPLPLSQADSGADLPAAARDASSIATSTQSATSAQMSPASPSTLAGANAAAGRAEGEPMLVFRVADEWFALSARFVAQVAEASAIHSLPKLRSKAVLGLANVRGQLTVCVSLIRLLDLTETPVDRSASGTRREGAGVAKERTAIRRFVVTRDVSTERARERRGDDATVFPVDEIFGIERFSRDAHRAVPATLTHAAAFHTRSIVDWRGRSVGVLDSTLLFETLRRSLG